MSQQSSIQALKPFEMVIDNTIAGSSGVGNFQIRRGSGTYKYKVEWGDGSVSAVTTNSDITHVYPSGGTYTIKIRGRFDSFQYIAQAEADKILSINSWGNIPYKDFDYAFYGSANLTGITSDAPNIESIVNHNDVGNTDFRYGFGDCINMDGDFGLWDVSNVTSLLNFFRSANNFNNGGSPSISGWTTSACTNMNSMFYNNFIFNQPIGSWDVSNVIDMGTMFRGCSQFSNSGDTSISGWNTSACVNMSGMFLNADNFNHDIGNWDVSNVVLISSMFNLNNGFNNGGSPSISAWTINSGVTSMGSMFRFASAFNQPIGSWDVSNVQNFSQMFFLTAIFNQDLGNWDMGSATNLASIFQSSGNFNNGGSPSISGWTTSACTNMSQMFRAALSFNQDIGAWDVSNVVNFNRMFNNMNDYNNGGSPSISAWTINTTNPSGVDMSEMFQTCDQFNQPIGSWDVSNVVNMSSMFNNADQFNQLIGSWDVSNVQDMSLMFNDHQTFNQDLSGWNVSGVTDMSSMFNNQGGGGDFNNSGSTGISGWTTSYCTNMSEMFKRQVNFNQPIGSWDVSNVQNFSDFIGAGIGTVMDFNQDLSNWDVGNSTNMSLMFDGCNNFDQDLSGWNVSGVTDMSNMLDDTNLSVTNYDSILTGWTGWDGTGATKTLVSGVTFGASGLNYSSGTTAEDARNYLTGTTSGLSWTITDAGGV